MKLNYDVEYRCSHCGTFKLTEQTNIHDSVDCTKCHRSSKFVRGTVWRLPEEETRKVHKHQKRITNE